MSLFEISQQLQTGQQTAQQVLQSCQERLKSWEPHLHSFLYLDEEGAQKQAEDVDRRRSHGENLGPLAGVPLAIKDNLCTRGLPTTAGSRILGEFRPPYEATVVE